MPIQERKCSILPRRRERMQLLEPQEGQYMNDQNGILAQQSSRQLMPTSARRAPSHRFFLIDSRHPSMFSMEVEYEKRRWPSPCSPKTIPGIVATFACINNFSAATRLSRSICVTVGKI